MNARDTRKSISALRKLCSEHGLELEVISAKGSHKSLVFTDPKTGRSTSFTIAGGKEISPGVQRAAIKYLIQAAARLPIAEIVRQIVESVFGS